MCVCVLGFLWESQSTSSIEEESQLCECIVSGKVLVEVSMKLTRGHAGSVPLPEDISAKMKNFTPTLVTKAPVIAGGDFIVRARRSAVQQALDFP